MTPITIDNILLVEVPQTAKNIAILDCGWEIDLAWDCANFIDTVRLPPGSWQFIGTTDEVSEEIAAKIVEPGLSHGYADYEIEPELKYCDSFIKAIDSYQSWLRANKIPSDKRFAILKLNP